MTSGASAWATLQTEVVGNVEGLGTLLGYDDQRQPADDRPRNRQLHPETTIGPRRAEAQRDPMVSSRSATSARGLRDKVVRIGAGNGNPVNLRWLRVTLRREASARHCGHCTVCRRHVGRQVHDWSTSAEGSGERPALRETASGCAEILQVTCEVWGGWTLRTSGSLRTCRSAGTL